MANNMMDEKYELFRYKGMYNVCELNCMEKWLNKKSDQN